MKRMSRLLALAGILGIAGVGGTFAYFNQSDTKKNIFNTGTYDTKLEEDFRPKDGENWKPGSTVNKDVTVKNNGSLPVVVRVKFREIWARTLDGKMETLYDVDTTLQKEMLGSDSTSRARNKFENVYQDNASDGLVGSDRDDSVVHKIMDPDSMWVYNAKDGYYYYKAVLPGKKGNSKAPETTKILDAIQLDENADMGSYTEKKYYAVTKGKDAPEKGSKDWIEFDKDSSSATGYVSTAEMAKRVSEGGNEITFLKACPVLIDNTLSGYQEADYTLRISAQTVQATDGAVQAIFGNLQEFSDLGCQWDLLSEDALYRADEPITSEY